MIISNNSFFLDIQSYGCLRRDYSRSFRRVLTKNTLASIVCIICLPLFVDCSKVCEDVEIELSEELKSVKECFCDFSDRISDGDCFLFFTDPHLLGSKNVFNKSIRNRLIDSFEFARQLYEILPLSFCLCGGDWLISGDTQEVAMQKLLFADNYMRNSFKDYYKILGNHDTNYQGVVSEENSSRGDLSKDFINNQYFSDTGSAYYFFKGGDTSFFVLDSGLDWTPWMDDYKREQIKWLARSLLDDNSPHNVICIHMFYDTSGVVPMSKELISLCDAYNHKSRFMIQHEEFDYSSTGGRIHLILSGHSHIDQIDYLGQLGDLPIVRTCSFVQGQTPTFDICVLDYDRGMLNMIRVGKGESREVHLSM